MHFNGNVRLRGGWTAGASMLVEAFGYPSEVYGGLPDRAAAAAADTVPFVGRPKIPNRDYVLQVDDPGVLDRSRATRSCSGATTRTSTSGPRAASRCSTPASTGGRPTSSGSTAPTSSSGSAGAPTAARSTSSTFRGSRWSTSSRGRSSSGWSGEYTSERQDDLRDHTRTEAPLLIFDPEVDDFVRAAAFTRESFRGDLLFSYQPNPGTVLFAGYGSTLRDPVDPTIRCRTGLRRADDGFFSQDELSVSDVGPSGISGHRTAPDVKFYPCRMPRPLLRLFGRALRLSCPNCGQGRLFTSWLRMRDALSRCAGSSSSAAKRAIRSARTCSTSSRRS